MKFETAVLKISLYEGTFLPGLLLTETRRATGTAGTKSVPLFLSTSALEVGWHAADVVLRNPRYGDVITARVAVLVAPDSCT